MDKKLIFEQITKNLETITEQTGIICSYEKKIPQIEIDIVLENVRGLYKKLHALDILNQQKAKLEEPKMEVIKQKTFHEEVFAEDNPVTEDPEIFAAQPIQEIKEESKTEIKNEVIEEPKIEKIITKSPKTTVDLFSSANTPSIIADKFKGESKSMNEKLASNKEDNSLASKIKQQHISDLKSAIGINEKFIFINELFDGSIQEFNTALSKLNSLAAYEEAVLFLNILADQYHWKTDSDSVKKIEELVQRRFQ